MQNGGAKKAKRNPKRRSVGDIGLILEETGTWVFLKDGTMIWIENDSPSIEVYRGNGPCYIRMY